jgi:hypothetical protein
MGVASPNSVALPPSATTAARPPRSDLSLG